MDFISAVRHLCNLSRYIAEPQSFLRAPPSPTPFVLPPKNANNDRVIEYLSARGIHLGLIRACINTGRLYEDRRHNCVFVGFDRQRIPRFGFMRSSDSRSTFMQEVKGSDKQYGFALPVKKESETLNVFESSIDALSYPTLEFMHTTNWKPENYLALSGVYHPRKEISETPLPIALARYLHDNPQIEQINLCLDNDKAGKLAAQAIITILGDKYDVRYLPPAHGKDYNQMLMEEKGLYGVKTRQSKCKNMEEISR